MSTVATRRPSRAPCPAQNCSTWRARPVGSWRPMTSARRRARQGARNSHHHRQQLGQPDLPAAVVAQRRPRRPLGLQISGRPQRRRGRRGRRVARADRPHPRRDISVSGRQAVTVRRLAADPRPAHAADPHAGASAGGSRNRQAAAGSPDRREGLPPRTGQQAAATRAHGHIKLFSFVFREGIDIRAFADRLQLFKLGVSWGGHREPGGCR